MSDLSVPIARDCMSTEVLTFSPEDDLFSAIDLLLKNHFAAAPVVDEDDCLLGILTEKDCLRVLSQMAYDNNFVGGKVSEFQSTIRMTCEPDRDIFGITELFLSTNFPLLPVVEGGKLCGVISRRDVLRGAKSLREQVNQEFSSLEEVAGQQANRPRSIESMQRTVANQSRDQLVRLFRRR